jgi:ribonuclease R
MPCTFHLNHGASAAAASALTGGMNSTVTLRGAVHVHEKGFGFVTEPATDGGPPRSAFVPPPLLNALLHDDVVEARCEVKGDRATVVAATLLSRPRRTLFGRLLSRGGQRFVRVDRSVANTDWPVHDAADLRDGLLIVGDIVRDGDTYTLRYRHSVDDADAPLWALLLRHRLEPEASAAVEQAARDAPDLAGLIAAELPRRRDLRALPLVTIDAESTKDIDDAVYCDGPDDDGALRVLVAIADVGALVAAGSVLDDDARARATSVYLPDRVLPMLPRSLSEDRLSLLPQVERLCLCAELRIDADGVVTAVDVQEGVMKSAARLSYAQVRAFLDDGDANAVTEPAVRETLLRLRAAAARLSVQRRARGGVAVMRRGGRRACRKSSAHRRTSSSSA